MCEVSIKLDTFRTESSDSGCDTSIELHDSCIHTELKLDQVGIVFKNYPLVRRSVNSVISENNIR